MRLHRRLRVRGWLLLDPRGVVQRVRAEGGHPARARASKSKRRRGTPAVTVSHSETATGRRSCEERRPFFWLARGHRRRRRLRRRRWWCDELHRELERVQLVKR